MKISKNNYSPNDRFLIKIFMKIISLDSSQRVPPMSPCPPLIITTVCPWLINPLSDPWDFNKSNGILLRSNWRKPYPKFYGSEFYGSGCVYLGVVKKTSQKVPPLPSGGGFINPVLALSPSSLVAFEISMKSGVNAFHQAFPHFQGLEGCQQQGIPLDRQKKAIFLNKNAGFRSRKTVGFQWCNHPLYLVGGIPTPLKNMSSSVGMMTFPIYGKIKKCSKPPTSNYL